MQKEIELLAPAGTWEALEAAVNAGADAVYLGGKAFGARAYASNFDREEMEKAVYFCHMHHVRLYVTVNTLVDDKELPELEDYLVFLHNVGVDGIIVQDMGVIRAAQKLVPGLPTCFDPDDGDQFRRCALCGGTRDRPGSARPGTVPVGLKSGERYRT